MRYFIPMGWWFIGGLFPLMAFAEEDNKPRPFFEYKGDYRGDLNEQKSHFRKAYGYELLDLDSAWRPDEIRLMSKAFAQLPALFYRIPELKGFYRVSHIRSTRDGLPAEEVPSATFPAYSAIFRHQSQEHHIYIENDLFRVEFYNPLFHEDERQAINIIHHEMAHALDVSRGLISVSKLWLEISHFKTLHLPALDQRKNTDFLFTFINQSEVNRYAPVSTRHQKIYSRLNPQEDFANSIVAYMHYPYFRSTNSNRYRYLKQNIFQENEYFENDGSAKDFEQLVLADLKRAFKEGNWKKIEQLTREISRGHYPKATASVSDFLLAHLKDLPLEAVDSLVIASCFLMHPDALKFRRDLVRRKKIHIKQVFEKKRCLITGRDSFEKILSKQPITNLYYFRSGGRDYIQFLDPVEPLAFTRGFVTQYEWELHFAGETNKPLAEGQANFPSGENGSFRLNLQKSANRKFTIPAGPKLFLRMTARRSHPRNFKVFHSKPTVIQFVTYSWFKYMPDQPPNVKPIYPLNLLSLSRDQSK